jgi:hypothetical protein
MKRIIVLAAAVAAGALATAQGSEGTVPEADGQASGFSLAGSAGAWASLAVANEDSVFAPVSTTDTSSAAGLIDGKLTFSKDYSALGLLDFSFSDSMVIDHESGTTIEEPTFEINELYADLNMGDALFLRLGKQRLSWGAGYVFNPSDPVNPPKDPTASRSVREGVPALKAELITEHVSVMAFTVLHDEARELGYGAKLSTSAIPNSDIAVSGYWSPSQSWTAALNASIAPFYDFPGWDTIQVWLEGGIYDEARYEPASTGIQYAALAGFNAQIPTIRTIVLAEYYHLSEGLTKDEYATAYSSLGPLTYRLAARPARVAPDYLFASLRQPSITDSGDPVLDKIGLSATCLMNLADLSFYASGGISLGFVDDASIDLGADWFSGSDESEFGNAPTSLSLRLEMKVFF